MSKYWEEAISHAAEAHLQENEENYELAFAMYKTAIICLLGGVQGDPDAEQRIRVKEKASQYLLQAEWIFNNHLALQSTSQLQSPKLAKVPWRSRSQLKRYKVLDIVGNSLLVHDAVENTYVVIKGVLKSSCPIDRSEISVLPKDVPFMVKLLALHETETTIFFVLEYIRYGKLWNHLDHLFCPEGIGENLDTELTSATPQEQDGDDYSLGSSNTSSANISLSRLESSICTDTMSCESLSSHEENYFDLIEDYARAKSKKLKEIRDFNERRKHVENLRPVKKTVSQVDLKSLNDCFDQCRSHSLTDLSYENEIDDGNAVEMNLEKGHLLRKNYSFDATTSNDDDDKYLRNREYGRSCYSSDEENENSISADFTSSVDLDTQQLLKNAQKLIDSINETLAKSEITVETEQKAINSSNKLHSHTFHQQRQLDVADEQGLRKNEEKIHDVLSNPAEQLTSAINAKTTFTEFPYYVSRNKYYNQSSNLCSPMSPISNSIPSITEEYSITALLQKNGITNELIKKWATEILIALDTLHQNGIICKDFNPSNILLCDNGTIKLTYFFRYPNVDRNINNYAKERLYTAPEVIAANSNATFASDWWSLGAILYELVTLQTLYDSHPAGIHDHTTLNIPENLPVETRSLLNELLCYDPNERLGSGMSGADDIKSHPFFNKIIWEDLL